MQEKFTAHMSVLCTHVSTLHTFQYAAGDNAGERCYYGEINKFWEFCDHTKYVVVNNVYSCLHLLLNSGI